MGAGCHGGQLTLLPHTAGELRSLGEDAALEIHPPGEPVPGPFPLLPEGGSGGGGLGEELLQLIPGSCVPPKLLQADAAQAGPLVRLYPGQQVQDHGAVVRGGLSAHEASRHIWQQG